jgi:hypothetical protein
MTTWKRWTWRYRIGALFALMLLLQGASCPEITNMLPRYQVPGVGSVVPEKYYASNVGKHYYVVERPQTLNGVTTYVYSYYYEGSPQYQAIDTYFRAHAELPVVGFERFGIPGSAGSLPTPPVQ